MADVTLFRGLLRRGSPRSAGYDLFACLPPSETVTLWPGKRATVGVGVRARMADGVVGVVYDRSGLAAENGVTTLAGVIDGDYADEYRVVLLNTGDKPVTFANGDRVAQVVFLRTTHDIDIGDDAEIITGPTRDGGFGSTGSN